MLDPDNDNASNLYAITVPKRAVRAGFPPKRPDNAVERGQGLLGALVRL